MGWDFKSKADAEGLLRMLRSGDAGDAKNNRRSGRPSVLVKAPAGGITERTSVGATEDARDEFNMGIANCTLLSTYTPTGERDQSFVRTVRTPDPVDATNWPTTANEDWKDSQKTVLVSNPHPVPIAEGQMVTAVWVSGSYVVADIPRTVLLKTVTSISARSGLTPGQASDVKYCYINTATGDIVERANPTLTVLNPFSSTIAADTYITAKLVGEYLMVDAEDCPAT